MLCQHIQRRFYEALFHREAGARQKHESCAEVTVLIFVALAKFRKPPDKKDIGDTTKIIEDWKKKGVNMLNWYWTLGRYDAVVMFEAKMKKKR